MAVELFEKAKSGGDFDAMVKEHTDDSHPGIYTMTNFDVDADPAKKISPRAGMVPAFGDTGFPLKVGEYGLATYDLKKSKYGWHIVKRVK